MSTRYVLFYEAAEDVMETAPLHFPAHSARIQEFHAAGALLLVGTFGDPVREGSMAVFASREAPRTSSRATPSFSTAS
jgi:uncharacterized protein YciI